MKILFYIATMEHVGGAERVMSVIANGLCARGDDVILVNDFRHRGLEYAIDEKIERYYLTEDNQGNYLKKNVKRIHRLRKLLKQIRPDVAISFLFMQNLRMIFASAGLKTTKIISVRNDPKREFGEKGIKKWMLNYIYGFADGIVFQTEEEKSYFSKKILKKSAIIFNPIDEKFYNIKRSNEPRDILTFGRLAKQKNQKMLIDAFRQARKAFPDERLYIYGDGELRPELETFVEDNGLSEFVFLPGRVSDVEEKLAKAKLFVLCSNYEGLPNAVMEAMAAGVPVIATSCSGGGPQTLIQDGYSGRLVECNNVSQMASALEECMENDDILTTYAENARNKAENYRTDSILDQWEDFINRSLRRKGVLKRG